MLSFCKQLHVQIQQQTREFCPKFEKKQYEIKLYGLGASTVTFNKFAVLSCVSIAQFE